MKKIIGAAVLLTALLSLSGLVLKAESSLPTFDVTLTTMFDSENSGVASEFPGEPYGTPMKLDNSFGDTSGHEFAFWVVNGSVRNDLPVDHEFVVKDTLNIQAVFSKTGEHAAAFMDTNGKLINSQYVSEGNDAINPVVHTETFDNYPETSTSYADGTFVGVNGIKWTYEESSGYSDIDGSQSLTLDKKSDNSLLRATIEEDIESFKVDYTNAYSGDAGLELYIDGELQATSPEVNGTVGTFEVNDIDTTGSFELKLEPSNAQTIIDNLTLSTFSGFEVPDKPGYVISESNRWDKALTNITFDDVYILQYEKDTSETYDLTVQNGSGEGTYDYNDIATVTPDDAPSDESFSHWEVNNEIVSFDTDYAFTMLEEKTAKPVFKETPETETPLITMSKDLALRTGYESYLSQFHVPDDHELIDYGLIGSDEEAAITLESANVTKYTGDKYNGTTDEFLTSLGADHNTIRAYLVVKNTQGDTEQYYSDYEAPLQFTQSFDESELTGTYGNGTYNGIVDFDYVEARDDAGYPIDDGGILLRGASTPSSLSVTYTNGLDAFAFDYRKGYTGSTDRTYEVNITNDNTTETYTVDPIEGWSGTDHTIYDFRLEDLALEGDVTVEIVAIGSSDNQQTVFNNIAWTEYNPSE